MFFSKSSPVLSKPGSRKSKFDFSFFYELIFLEHPPSFRTKICLGFSPRVVSSFPTTSSFIFCNIYWLHRHPTNRCQVPVFSCCSPFMNHILIIKKKNPGLGEEYLLPSSAEHSDHLCSKSEWLEKGKKVYKLWSQKLDPLSFDK